MFCGGGSGGHLFPAIAVAEELRRRFENSCRIVFLTTGRQIENQVLSDDSIEQFPLGEISSINIRKAPIKSSLQLVTAIRKARSLYREMRPDVVIGLGGFGSVPGVLAAKLHHCPIVLLEQNAVAGRANSLLCRFADSVCTSFSNTTQLKARNTVETGNPVRTSIVQASQSRSNKLSKQLLILGGSQGSVAINNALLSLVKDSPALFSGWKVIHQTGHSQLERIAEIYRKQDIDADVRPFFEEIEKIMANSDFAISRAGATTLAELAIMGVPGILVPDPNSIRDHQEKNAERFAQTGAAVIVNQSDDSTEFEIELRSAVEEMVSHDTRRLQMQSAMQSLARPEAANNVADVILSFLHDQ